jgi:hypothetical protein
MAGQVTGNPVLQELRILRAGSSFGVITSELPTTSPETVRSAQCISQRMHHPVVAN